MVPPRQVRPHHQDRCHGDGAGLLDARRPGDGAPRLVTAELAVTSCGPGAEWARDRAMAMTGRDHDPGPVADVHPLVTDAVRRLSGVRSGASGDLYHALLPTIIAQRITSGEAVRQWARLCHELGEPPPGPDLGLLLPPRPDRLAGRPAWWFHPLGIEAKRADALAEVGRIAERLWDWAALPVDQLAAKLTLVAGVGPWTVGSVLGPVCGDDDAVIVGDYHLPHLVAWNLAGEPRADDARMLDLLEPFRGGAVGSSVCSASPVADRLPSARAAGSCRCTDGDRARPPPIRRCRRGRPSPTRPPRRRSRSPRRRLLRRHRRTGSSARGARP